MSDAVIRVENLGKKYVLSHQRQEQRYKALRDVLAEGAKSLGRRLLWQCDASDPTHEDFWALKDVSFEIKQGDRVGIIGRNGAGKSTLLKILSRIVEPTTGEIGIRGRVASLLEVGTGFHPELTGRENIFLNGAILGMGKSEITRKFDEIVAFAEVEKFLDTPVKRYSSGMYVRLAFAVAAHLEPEILIVDEVLAVGDAQFQKKCLGKMEDVAGNGRTVIFVSHSVEAIQQLCSSCIVLEQGQLAFYGHTEDAIVQYLSSQVSNMTPANTWINLLDAGRVGSGEARFTAMHYSSCEGSVGYQPYCNGPLKIELEIESDVAQSIASLAVSIYSQTSVLLLNLDVLSIGQEIFLKKGRNRLHLQINSLHILPGRYIVRLWMHKTGSIGLPIDYLRHALDLEIVSSSSKNQYISLGGFVTADFSFSVLEANLV
jgi:lipopolysaccharide transport system ATP-binding protein